MTATYENIATTTLSSASSTITFNSIAASWTDLRVILTGTLTSSDGPFLRLNNDSGSNYSFTNLYGDGSAASSQRGTTRASIPFNFALNWTTTNPAMEIIDIFSYAGSTNKTVLLRNAMDLNGSGQMYNAVGLYRSTAAITRIDLIAGSTTFTAGTTATLFGIKAE